MPESKPTPSITTSDDRSPLRRLCGNELCIRLGALCVGRVVIKFDGVAGHGVIEAIGFESKAGKPMVGAEEVLIGERSLYQAIEEVVLDDLYANHPGWTRDEGSFGTYKLGVEGGAVSVGFVARPLDEDER